MNTHFAAFSIPTYTYKIDLPLHRLRFRISAEIRFSVFRGEDGFARGICAFSSYNLFDFHFRAFLAHTLVRCFRVSISYFLWNFVTYLHRKHILVSLFPTIRGLDRKIPSGGAFLYLRLLKLAPLSIKSTCWMFVSSRNFRRFHFIEADSMNFDKIWSEFHGIS